MDLQLAKWWRRRSILVELMWLLFVLVILVVIARAAWWCWTKWLSLAGQVHTLLAIGAILNFFQLIFAPARRRCTHWLVQYGAFAAFYFPFPVVAYALSIMRSASHNEADLHTIVIWAQLINLAVSRRRNSMASYRLSDTIQHGMRHAQRILYPLYWLIILVIACWDKDNHLPSSHTLIAMLITFYISSRLIVGNFRRLVVPHIVSSYKSKKLAEYMLTEANHPKSLFDSDEIDMKNCRYPLEMRCDNGDQVMARGNGPECSSSVLAVVKDVIGKKTEHVSQVCLSYSLFNMILRRRYGFSCAEQGNERVLEFVRTEFPAGQNDHPNQSVSTAVQNNRPNQSVSTESSAVQNDHRKRREIHGGIRAFEVVEMQLAFLHDHFFVERSLHHLPPALPLSSLELAAIFALINYLFIRALDLQTYNRRLVELLLFQTVFAQEFIQYNSYVTSDWFQVWTVLQRCCGQISLEGKIYNSMEKYVTPYIELYIWSSSRKYWQDKIGQYSLIKDCDNLSVRKTLGSWLTRYLLDERYDFVRHHPVEMDPVSLPDIVKEDVFYHFYKSKGRLANGVSSLKGNNVSELLSWTCNQPTHTDTILTWHVATWYCECETEKGSRVRDSLDYKVATALSKYCAYLVAFLPEFLPEHSLTTTNVFQGVLKEAKELLDRAELEKGVELGQLPRSREDKFTLIKELELPPEGANLNTVENGVKLGRQLKSLVGSAEDPELRRWKVMAEFWAETMVYVAPSDKVSAHIDQLAKGGEFVTHIWALLSDAGILERPTGVNESTAPPVDPPEGPPPNHEEAGNGTGISPS